MEALEQALGYTFRDKTLLRLALTHASIKPLNNQRLEFLGDAVLEICVSDMLYRRYPQSPEGQLTPMRARLVDERTLSEVGRKLKLGMLLDMASGEENTGGRERSGNLCDAVEAVLAAVYLDGGFPAALRVVERLFADPEGMIEAHGGEDKGELQEWAQARGLSQPSYEIIAREGPDHQPVFTARVTVQENGSDIGSGKSKREAEKAAARAALHRLLKK